MQRISELKTKLSFFLFGGPRVAANTYVETDARIGVMADMAEELGVMTQVFRAKDKKNKQENEKLRSTLAMQRIQTKNSEKTPITATTGTDEELYNRVQELIATYPDESPDLEEIRNHHAVLCEVFTAYLQQREQQDREFEKTQSEKKELLLETFGGISHGR